MTRTYLTLTAVITMAFAVVGPLHADYDLQISEIWMGNEPGNNLTPDWFEVTNYGTTAWEAAIDGDLYYDDESFDSDAADPMTGIDSISPGESVVYINEGELGVFLWNSVWESLLSPLPPIGQFDGSGLGQGGDAVGVWVSMAAPSGAPSFTASYPDANANGGQSYDTILGAFSTVGNTAGALATALNNEGQPAIASPGSVGVIPEPGSLALVGIGLSMLAFQRR